VLDVLLIAWNNTNKLRQGCLCVQGLSTKGGCCVSAGHGVQLEWRQEQNEHEAAVGHVGVEQFDDEHDDDVNSRDVRRLG